MSSIRRLSMRWTVGMLRFEIRVCVCVCVCVRVRCYMPVPCQLWWRWLKPCHGNYINLVGNLMHPTAKYSQQNSWITQCMLNCHRIWCMFFMRGLPTSILADTSWEPETAWLCGITSSQNNRLDKIQQTSDHTYKQTREFEIALEIPQCCCHASYAFQFAHVGTDESAVRKHQRTTAQNVAINCWLGASEWGGLVWDDATNESQTQCGFGTLPYSTMDGTTCQTPISICCQDSIGAMLVINCWTLDLHNWLAGKLWQYAVSQAWTSTGKMGWQTVAHHTSIFPIALPMARGGQTALLAKWSFFVSHFVDV